jgi:hypothetical protein
MTSRLSPFVKACDAWLRARTPAELATQEEVEDLLQRVRADDELWARQRPRFETVWRRGEERLRGEQRALRELLRPETVGRLVEAAESADPDPEAVRTFLRSPAIEAMLGEVLYNGISEFIKRADLIGRVVDKLPVLGGIRRRVTAVFKDEVEGRLEGQIKGFLGTFSGRAVDRMIQYVLSDEHKAGFAEARKRVAEHLLDRPVRAMVPPPETTDRWREALWESFRKQPPGEEDHLTKAYAEYGAEPLDTWMFETSDGLKDLIGRALERFLESERAEGWSIQQP